MYRQVYPERKTGHSVAAGEVTSPDHRRTHGPVKVKTLSVGGPPPQTGGRGTTTGPGRNDTSGRMSRRGLRVAQGSSVDLHPPYLRSVGSRKRGLRDETGVSRNRSTTLPLLRLRTHRLFCVTSSVR